ncbi:hypothetical protein PIB19_03915 [Sphingomonas sp. 7/4-4]|uniref:hypothetical protein n=1 Tax=Sphingomonas sp. 7/4-4 TaxID=3018446 RepID=UPI0022F3E823|nr:hypothetical protein [Sphingomonas sp. 7/4-4]WBY08624.1 hypothetical protein PIB19_03915 [Sphingomonas sp. 7/4-4]
MRIEQAVDARPVDAALFAFTAQAGEPVFVGFDRRRIRPARGPSRSRASICSRKRAERSAVRIS